MWLVLALLASAFGAGAQEQTSAQDETPPQQQPPAQEQPAQQQSASPAQTPPSEAGNQQAQPAAQTPSATPSDAARTAQSDAGAGDADINVDIFVMKVGDPEAGAAKAAICATCHGPQGNSTNPAWPKLAGQNADYTFTELMAFKTGARQDPLMTPQAATLSKQDMADLAVYYAAQTMQPGVAEERLVSVAEKIYRGGIRSTNVPACIACHGPAGLGIAAAGFPAIGGQHALYTFTTLQDYASGARHSQNNIMNYIAAGLSEEEMEALASYLEGLHFNQNVLTSGN